MMLTRKLSLKHFSGLKPRCFSLVSDHVQHSHLGSTLLVSTQCPRLRSSHHLEHCKTSAHTSLGETSPLAISDSKRTGACYFTIFPEGELGILDELDSDYIRPPSVLQVFVSLSFPHAEIHLFPPQGRQFKIPIQSQCQSQSTGSLV